MDWLNLHIPTALRSPAYVGSSPAERGTWLSVLAYACEIECGGRLAGAASWKDRQWQQACGVTLREVRGAWKLLRFEGEDVVVNGYPVAREKQVRDGRKAAGAGAMARWPKTPPNGTPIDEKGQDKGDVKGADKGGAKVDAEGEGEGEGEGEEASASPSSTPEEQVARRLGTWIRWRAKDPERQAANLAEIGQLVARYGEQVVQQAAERVCHRKRGEKAWVEEILPEILAVQAPKPPEVAAAARHKTRARVLVEAHGWERVRAALGIPVLRSAEEVIACLELMDPAALDALQEGLR